MLKLDNRLTGWGGPGPDVCPDDRTVVFTAGEGEGGTEESDRNSSMIN